MLDNSQQKCFQEKSVRLFACFLSIFLNIAFLVLCTTNKINLDALLILVLLVKVSFKRILLHAICYGRNNAMLFTKKK